MFSFLLLLGLANHFSFTLLHAFFNTAEWSTLAAISHWLRLKRYVIKTDSVSHLSRSIHYASDVIDYWGRHLCFSLWTQRGTHNHNMNLDDVKPVNVLEQAPETHWQHIPFSPVAAGQSCQRYLSTPITLRTKSTLASTSQWTAWWVKGNLGCLQFKSICFFIYFTLWADTDYDNRIFKNKMICRNPLLNK